MWVRHFCLAGEKKGTNSEKQKECEVEVCVGGPWQGQATPPSREVVQVDGACFSIEENAQQNREQEPQDKKRPARVGGGVSHWTASRTDRERAGDAGQTGRQGDLSPATSPEEGEKSVLRNVPS